MVSESKNADLGFGTKGSGGERLLNRNGSFNVERRGLPYLESFSLFHLLTGVSTPKFILILLGSYAFLNGFFSIIYVSIGVQYLGIDVNLSTGEKIMEAFFFSAQTLTTVGYGHLYPSGLFCNLVAALESLTGLIMFAIITGVVYGRFSKPEAKLIFSKNAIISPFKDGNALMFRLANKLEHALLDIEVSAVASMEKHNDPSQVRQFYNLNFDRKSVNLLPTTWTVVHPIDHHSPFDNLTEKDLLDRKLEIIIIIRAFDESFSQNIQYRYSYLANEIVWNVKFLPAFILSPDRSKTIVQLDRLNAFESVS